MSKLDEMEAFVAIARSGSISKAAGKLGTAKSAMSRRLSDLEARLGVQLIIRTTRQLSLTDEGASYLERAEHALDTFADAENAVRNEKDQLSGTIRIAAPVSYGLSKLKPVFTAFMLDHPNVDMHVDFSDRNVDLVQDGFDMAIRIGKLEDSSLIARRVTSVQHRVVASPNFWKTHGVPESPADLEILPFLRYSNGRRRDKVEYSTAEGVKGTINPHQRANASNGDFLAQLAVAGIGFMVEPEFIVDEHLASGELEEVLSDHSWLALDLYIVFPANRRITKRTRVFADCVRTALAQD
ncbi:MAG: DNA-binding transcriptional LysR family regulator [Porticoccaceae bacterium]|jgi:DNA-binding transcriptional LysR family regulator